MIRRYALKRRQSLRIVSFFLRRAILLCLNEIEDPFQVNTWFVVCPQPIPFYLSNEGEFSSLSLSLSHSHISNLFRFLVSTRQTFRSTLKTPATATCISMAILHQCPFKFLCTPFNISVVSFTNGKCNFHVSRKLLSKMIQCYYLSLINAIDLGL